MKYVDFESLAGKTLTEIKVNEYNDQITFDTSDGERYLMWHEPDCCECVDIEDICGDLQDLIGTPILSAYASMFDREDGPEIEALMSEKGYTPESFTWTFYRISTIKGTVTIRWYGTSNGYYSESVSFGLQFVRDGDEWTLAG